MSNHENYLNFVNNTVEKIQHEGSFSNIHEYHQKYIEIFQALSNMESDDLKDVINLISTNTSPELLGLKNVVLVKYADSIKLVTECLVKGKQLYRTIINNSENPEDINARVISTSGLFFTESDQDNLIPIVKVFLQSSEIQREQE